VLNKPFAEITDELGLPAFTQRGLRRTYNDLAAAAGPRLRAEIHKGGCAARTTILRGPQAWWTS
jgi:hypothetical protein